MDLNDYVTAVPDFPINGVSFKDISPMLAEPAAFQHSVEQLTAATDGWEFDVVAGFDARGFLWAAPLALQLGLPLVPIRKAGKLPRETAAQSYDGEYGSETIEIHRDAFPKGAAVLLVDDVIATGNSMRAGCSLVEKSGARVAGCVTVIELTYLGAPELLADYRSAALLSF